MTYIPEKCKGRYACRQFRPVSFQVARVRTAANRLIRMMVRLLGL